MPTHVILQPDPYLVPALLLLTGLAGLLLASIRGRSAATRRRMVRATWALLAVIAMVASATMAFHRSQLFWEITWQEQSSTLVLDRPLPLGQVRLDRSEVMSVTEFSAVERSVTGKRRAVRFQVRTKDGDSYWSAPLYGQSAVDTTRLALLNATRGRLQRFLVGLPPSR
ncbi:MAG TPA: hypothetical protein ENK10_09875 [Acidobacteria bacterium]|nr:hypothetical protein [Acidobacteriota bacterium]